MSIAPVISTVKVKAAPERTFQLFVTHISQWWEKGRTVGKNPHVALVIEPKAGGRWFERDAEGAETDWGKVLAYEPPHRLLLGWQLDSGWKYDPDFLTEVEITFTALADGGTEVRLEHRNLERFGTKAPDVRASIDGGWPKHMADFAIFVEQHQA